MHDYELYKLSDRSFRVWVYLRCAESYFGGCLPSDIEIARYCRIKPRAFARAVAEMIEAGLLERAADDHLAIISRRYEAARVNAAEWSIIRSQVFDRDNYTCTYCGERGGRLECDHIHPHSRGGSDDLENLTTACFACNRSKRDKTLEEWGRRNGTN